MRNQTARLGRTAMLGLAAMAVLQAHLPTITLSSKYVNLVAAPGSNPTPQIVRLGTNQHPYVWSAAVATTRGGPWLSVFPDRGSFNGNFESTSLRISAASASLAAGVYYGTVIISAPATTTTPPTDNTPQVIEVALTVTTSGQAAPGFAITPAAFAFEGVRGSGRSEAQSMQVQNVGGGSLNWTATAATDAGGAWLTVNPGSGANTGLLTVAAAPGSLAAGVYAGRITLAADGAANSPLVVPVSFRVRDPLPPELVLTPATVTFSTPAGDPFPPSQTIVITNAGEGTLAWRVTATTFNGGPWFSARPVSGSGRGVVTLSADAGALGPGTYAGRLTITADGAVNSPLVVPVTLSVRRPQPFFVRIGVVNAATFQPTPVAPGEILSIFGARLGPLEGVVFTLDPETRRMPTSLGGVQITFDGVAAPLFFVSEQQVNLQVPYEVAGRALTRMVVNVEGQDPAEMTLEVTEAAPGLFTLDGTRAAALNQDSTLNGPDNPAAVGSIVQLFLTGQGLLKAAVRTGELAPTSPPFPEPVLPVSARIDGYDARVLFAGLAPGFVGLTQLNVEVPRGVLPTSRAAVLVAFGLNQAVKAATIAVQ